MIKRDLNLPPRARKGLRTSRRSSATFAKSRINVACVRNTPEANRSSINAHHQKVHFTICSLLLLLIFEGLLRKLLPPAAGLVLFFLKDLIALGLLALTILKPDPAASIWLRRLGILLGLLLPCLVVTAVSDPVLALFGLKQYILFGIVGVSFVAAYPPQQRANLSQLLWLIALSVGITTAVAVAQNRLPAEHWLNLSVAGEDMSGFSAGGYLRVSSTFSFVGQYCFYLNALCFLLPAFYLGARVKPFWLRPALTVGLVGSAAVGIFVTGSRTAVIGGSAILVTSATLIIIVGEWRAIQKLFLPIVAGAILLGVSRSHFPEFFAAYNARVENSMEETHSIEIQNRVKGSLLGWTEGTENARPNLFGYGLGVMSNGSDRFSRYAASWRSSGFWTETDQATTLFEGGWYLVVVWYGFRLWIIWLCVETMFKLRGVNLKITACFACGFIIVQGVMGTLAIQPPLAIWWWLAVGLVACLKRFDIADLAAAQSHRDGRRLIP